MKKILFTLFVFVIAIGCMNLLGETKVSYLDSPENILKKAVYNHFVLNDYKNAKTEYEKFLNSFSDKNPNDELLKKGLMNYVKLLKSQNETEELVGLEDRYPAVKSVIDKSKNNNSKKTKKTTKIVKKSKTYIKNKRLYAKRLSIKVKNKAVSEILDMMQKNQKIKIIYPDSFSKKKISILLKNTDLQTLLQMIAQLTKSSLVQNADNVIFEDDNSGKIKKERKYFIQNTSLAKIQSSILEKLNKENFKLLSINSENRNSFTLNVLITDEENQKLQRLISTSSNSTYEMMFNIYSLTGEKESLVSSPKLIVNDSKLAKIDIENAEADGYSSLSLSVSVRKESKNLFNVKLFIKIIKKMKRNLLKVQSSSEFNTAGTYNYDIFNNKGEKKYRVDISIIERKSDNFGKNEKKVSHKIRKKNSSLMAACRKGNFEIIKMLVEAGEKINYKGSGGYTAVHELL